ncbi:MAG: hypothetical protein JRI71_01035 [Deltaproteobacteria bacterium]|nr:hypothetical protein [Deltaproteobacteria bacterium]
MIQGKGVSRDRYSDFGRNHGILPMPHSGIFVGIRGAMVPKCDPLGATCCVRRGHCGNPTG